ncbi:MAG: pyruvate, phosphate dikinase [Acidobacteria bacterium]|nr:pyruvate, phosphate dikinase [Thermoanaerobaculia bacterium]NLN11976.1 pyruvate, phosphate dikinase [Acidobacteriota bacterium]MBP7812086.1 pyruvate, phosphate dikinase [Thermoanaerobaculia bacterium]MBP8845703.1 pyruvate, phosphate dikinase [Thermoanaerobaculia bacterium]HPA94761.1 pyruvate, phosphate dikinase [Thermoanaerobaculia bacterium]
MSEKWVYGFDELPAAEAAAGGSWDGLRGLLGGKGANLADMTRIGVPVPPGFTVTTAACNAYLAAGESFPPGLWEEEAAALARLEGQTGKRFGDPANPLLVSCRSGAKFSMPGMMDTVLNIGMNDAVVEGMAKLTGDERFAYDSYRRLIQMFGSVVMGVPDEPFEEVLTAARKKAGVETDSELDAAAWKAVTAEFKEIVRKHAGEEFPQDPITQIRLATEAVFRSWNGKRAFDYRKAAKIAHDLGTAVNICTMVFGNLGNDSATGVAMTRSGATGENQIEGDYLINAQGEDVVAGIRQTKPIELLKEEMPGSWAEFEQVCERLEQHYREMQDVEFTIERGKLWMLQTRDAKRTAQAAVRIAVDMVDEGLITPEQAVLRITPEQVDFFLHPQYDRVQVERAIRAGDRLAIGLNVSPGAAVGQIVLDADRTEQWAKEGRAVIMVRPETKPDDVHGMLAAKGILTSRGGRTSHAALVARQFGKPAVVGVAALEIDLEKRTIRVGERQLVEGDWVSIDGNTGEVFATKLDTVVPDINDPYLSRLLGWADEKRRLQVWANADYPADATRAREYGAQGIGLCRTEHMFFDTQRLPHVQRMILHKQDPEVVAACLDELLPYQRADFDGLFRAMDGLPVIVRLIDPPLHEFLPGQLELALEVAALERDGADPAKIAEKKQLLAAVERLHEANPMLGLRGVRLGIHLAALTRMQVRAIFEAACQCARDGVDVHPEIMIPLAGHWRELEMQQAALEEEGRKVMAEQGIEVAYKFGTMVEIPRAALTADQLARFAQFFSYGTNDLTQTTYAISRDDAEKGFLMEYLERGILAENPFASIDEEGVGKLMAMGVELGRRQRPGMEIGICGEHGGDPKSIDFCHRIGLNYVSCSPFRVPIARLAAAQAALREQGFTAK